MKINAQMKKLMLRESKLEKLSGFHKHVPQCIECHGWLGRTVYIVRLWEAEGGFSMEMFPLLHTIYNIRP